MHKVASSNDCGAPYQLKDSMPILSPDSCVRDFNKHEHALIPDKETFSRSPTPPSQVPARIPMNQHTSTLVDDDYEHRNADTHCRPPGESTRKDACVYYARAQATHGTYILPAYTATPLQNPQPILRRSFSDLCW